MKNKMYGKGKHKKKIHLTEKKKVKTSKKTKNNLQRSSLLLANLYFLNQVGTKYISLGYAIKCDCRPTIIISHDSNFVELTTIDWLSLFLIQTQIENWFLENSPLEDDLISTKNITIKKIIIKDKRFIQIQTRPKFRKTNSITLNQEEYKNCIGLNVLFQNQLKEMRNNSFHIDDYYNLYVSNCYLKDKKILDEQDYFNPIETNINFDSYRLFREIPVVCKEKLFYDLTISE